MCERTRSHAVPGTFLRPDRTRSAATVVCFQNNRITVPGAAFDRLKVFADICRTAHPILAFVFNKVNRLLLCKCISIIMRRSRTTTTTIIIIIYSILRVPVLYLLAGSVDRSCSYLYILLLCTAAYFFFFSIRYYLLYCFVKHVKICCYAHGSTISSTYYSYGSITDKSVAR
jgi:hypothetical protein